MAGREVAVKRYVVRLSAEERERLEDLRDDPCAATVEGSDLVESGCVGGWRGLERRAKIMKAFDTTDTMVYTVRKKRVEEGLDAVLSRKRRETPPVARIFDGEREAKLIALACSDPPPGFARWTLRLLEEKVVELQIVDRASDSTIGRVLKKVFSSLILKNAGSFRPRRTPLLSRGWRMCWRSTSDRTIPSDLWSVSTRRQSN